MPSGLTLKNEASLTEMTEILESLSQYIPTHESTREEIIEGTNYTFGNSKLIQILLFGDQLTIVCSRGATQLRDDKAAIDRLNGFIPAIADWYARMCLLQVRILHAYIISLCTCVGYMEKALQQGVFKREGYYISFGI